MCSTPKPKKLVNTEPTTKVDLTKKEETKQPEETKEVVQEIVEEKEDVFVEEVTYVAEPQTDIFYRVQLAAGRKNVSLTYIKKKHGFSDEIFLENHQGWYKYTTGNYPEYVYARNRREKIKRLYKFKGPFVTAYNSGERITVQEALLISKQKWVK